MARLIAYGLKDIADPAIFVEVSLAPCRAAAVVADNGAYFDIRDWEPAKNRDLMTGELGGFGVALIKERASRLTYRHSCGLNWLGIVCEPLSRDIA